MDTQGFANFIFLNLKLTIFENLFSKEESILRIDYFELYNIQLIYF